ncbi:DUF2231 domain-containing protein [Sulfurovum sp. ST-21]|uniref:DUF2231 domain-containing protein n=1 Tax=Sulfurovum TaxID=265570 RepID=UPI001E41617C|nr:DUF2231 domain-containing protein [Sulfurovum indicum]
MTLKELKQYNGKNGRKAYIAYKGNVYDVTESPLWKGGIHKKIHTAGADLTASIEKAPHSDEVFSGFTIVDRLTGSDTGKTYWIEWYRKYHPHPIFVHFPIALHIFAGGLDLIFLFSPADSYASAVFYTFFAATVTGALAMVPGILSWWINYSLAMTYIFIVKLVLSIITLLLGTAAVILYLDDPNIVYTPNLPGIIYHAIVLITTATVTVTAYYGAKLTWPAKRSK